MTPPPEKARDHISLQEDIQRADLCARLESQLWLAERSVEILAEQHKRDLESKDREIGRIQTIVNDRDRELHWITHSGSWKISWPYRATGRLVRMAIKALRLFVRSPRQLIRALVNHAAHFVRTRPKVRSAVQSLFDRLPATYRSRLSLMAPPTAEEGGHALRQASPTTHGMGGDWEWIYTRINS